MDEPEAPEPLQEIIPLFGDDRRATLFVRVTLPIVAFLGLLGSMFLVFPETYGTFLGGIITYLVPPAGKETVIPALVGTGYPPWLVATYIAGIDMSVAWFLAWNWDLVTRIPRVGDTVEDLMLRGKERLKATPLLDRSAFLGLALFVFVPFQGSGAVVGIILGRMIGLPPQRAWVAIMTGALLAAFSLAYASEAYKGLITAFGLDMVLQGTLIALGVGATVFLALRRWLGAGAGP